MATDIGAIIFKFNSILVATPVTKNKTINETLQQFSQKFINEFYKEAQKQESAYKKYIAKTNLESATFITNYVFFVTGVATRIVDLSSLS
jgi:ribonucleotide reductase beta subunit family protein with ferritin-like domain